MTLGEKIQSLRKERHISQEQLAESLNVSRQTVSKWERDLATPDTDHIFRLSKYFEVSVEDFLYETLESKIVESHGNVKTNLKNPGKYYFIIGFVLIVVSACSTYFAKLFDWIIHGSCYTNALNYLREFPLLCSLCFGIVLFLIGVIKTKKQYRK